MYVNKDNDMNLINNSHDQIACMNLSLDCISCAHDSSDSDCGYWIEFHILTHHWIMCYIFAQLVWI